MVYRIYVEKKPGFDGEAQSLRNELVSLLGIKELVWKGEHAFIGDGKIGPVTQKLYDTMTGMQWGKIPDTKGWIVPVEKKY